MFYDSVYDNIFLPIEDDEYQKYITSRGGRCLACLRFGET